MKQACRDGLKRAWKNKDGQICACDGFVGIRLTDPKYDLPLADKQVIDLDSLVDGAAKGITSEEENMPDAAALKTYYKVIAAEYKAKCNAKELRYLKDANNGYLPIWYRFESNGAYANLENLCQGRKRGGHRAARPRIRNRRKHDPRQRRQRRAARRNVLLRRVNPEETQKKQYKQNRGGKNYVES